MARRDSTTSRIGRGLSTFADIYGRTRELRQLERARREEAEKERELRRELAGVDDYRAAMEAQRALENQVWEDVAAAEGTDQLQTVTGRMGLPDQGQARILGALGVQQAPIMEEIGRRSADLSREEMLAFEDEVRAISAEGKLTNPTDIVNEARRRTGLQGPKTPEVSGGMVGAEQETETQGPVGAAIEEGRGEARQAEYEKASEIAMDFLERGQAADAVDEIRALEPARNFISDAVAAGNEGASGIQDTALVTTFARVLEPGGRAVTDSDFNNITRALGLPAEISAEIRRLFGTSGASFLTPEVRQAMLDITESRLADAQNLYQRFEDRYRRVAKGQGVSDEVVNSVLLGVTGPGADAGYEIVYDSAREGR